MIELHNIKNTSPEVKNSNKAKQKENKGENLKKIENRGFLAIFMLILSITFLLILWALFFVLSFAKTLVKITPFKRKCGKINKKSYKNEKM